MKFVKKLLIPAALSLALATVSFAAFERTNMPGTPPKLKAPMNSDFSAVKAKVSLTRREK